MELNASDERYVQSFPLCPPHTLLDRADLDSGIDVVRNKIKGFAQRKVTLPAGRHKIIILDEADS